MLYVNPLEANPLMRTDMATQQPFREKQALQEFERVFLYQFLREMRRGVPENSLFGRSREQEYVEEMLDDFLAGQMAKTGQFGIARQIQEQLHAAEALEHPGPEGMPALPAPKALAKQDDGMSLRKDAKAGFLLKPRTDGIPLKPRQQQGIPLHREAAKGISLRRGNATTAGTARPASSDILMVPINMTAGSGDPIGPAPAGSIAWTH